MLILFTIEKLFYIGFNVKSLITHMGSNFVVLDNNSNILSDREENFTFLTDLIHYNQPETYFFNIIFRLIIIVLKNNI